MKTETFINLARARVSFFAASLACGLLSLHAEPAAAATIFVNPSCSLQDAIIAANTDQARNGCPAGAAGLDTVELPANSTQTLTTAQAGGDSGSGLTITSPIVINGNGSTVTRSTDNPAGRLIMVAAGAGVSLVLNDLTVSGGGISGRGAGILNNGSLTLNRCTVSGNMAIGTSDGGGVYSNGGATLSLSSSTVSGNSARSGGGIYSNNGGAFTVSNSTISGNSASVSGGGIVNVGTLVMTDSTVSGNSAAAQGGGLYILGKTNFSRSLIAGNSAGGGQEVGRFSGVITAANNNAFGHSGESNSQAFAGFTPGATDLNATADGGGGTHTAPTGTPLSSILGALAGNGGPTRTHALPAGSPAIDAVGSVCAATDQRGVNRPQAAACDIGAFEVGRNVADLSLLKTASVDSAFVGDPIVYTLTVTNNGPDAATAVTLMDPLPAGMTYVYSSPVAPATGGCVYDAGFKTVTCQLGDLALNQTVTVNIGTTAAGSGTISNTASVVSDVIDLDPNSGNNTSEASVQINTDDTTPDAFRFTDVTGAPISTSMRSNSITVSGINAPAPLVLSGPADAAPQYSINGAGFKYYNLRNGQPTVSNGDTVQLRARSSASGGATVDLNLSIGSVSDTWSLSTASTASTPNAFDFKDKTNQPANRYIGSGGVRISGINTPVAISISGDPSASFRINNGGYIAGPATVSNGDLVVLRLKSSATPGASVSATVNIGGVMDSWTVTTAP